MGARRRDNDLRPKDRGGIARTGLPCAHVMPEAQPTSGLRKKGSVGIG